ncbi:hypothetical protein [Chitinophaga sp. XS-30]|uniref:hypothetical protein n=1 Tax=Chitinophaga sp. XS-30 TaxID=2604421 RepID=UPI00143DBFDD|nr:hypothetical protein [Chitinophaga sp. XS-30]
MHEYFKRLSDAEKKSVLQMLKTFLKGRKEHIVPQTVEEEKFTTLFDLEKEMQAW